MGTKTIIDKNQSNILKIPLIATDGSLIQSRSRRVASSATIFGEDSVLNSTQVCPDSISSTTPGHRGTMFHKSVLASGHSEIMIRFNTRPIIKIST